VRANKRLVKCKEGVFFTERCSFFLTLSLCENELRAALALSAFNPIVILSFYLWESIQMFMLQFQSVDELAK